VLGGCGDKQGAGQGALHVERHDDADGCSSRLAEEQDHRAASEELDREDAVRGVREDGQFLLDGEDGEKHKGEDEAGDDLAAVPGVQDATEGKGHDTTDEGSDENDGANPVDLLKASQHGNALSRVERWDHEEVDGREGGTEKQV